MRFGWGGFVDDADHARHADRQSNRAHHPFVLPALCRRATLLLILIRNALHNTNSGITRAPTVHFITLHVSIVRAPQLRQSPASAKMCNMVKDIKVIVGCGAAGAQPVRCKVPSHLFQWHASARAGRVAVHQ